MKKTILFLLALSPLYIYAQRIYPKLGRGVVAVQRPKKVHAAESLGNLISWRKLAQEPENAKYNVYINGSLATTTSATSYVPSSFSDGMVVKVVPVFDGKEQEDLSGSYTVNLTKNPYNNEFVHITFDTNTCDPDSFNAKFVWPVDLDGDGEYDYVVAQLSTNELQTPSLVQGYLSDGTFLWSVKMSPNVFICRGQNDNVVAADIDCDGKGEVIIRSSDGTRFWDKDNNTYGKYANFKDTPDSDGDGIVNYRSDVYDGELLPPYYISVIDGMTGEEKECAELDYSQVHDGYDSYNRETSRQYYKSDNYGVEYAFLSGHFAITYDDGVHPMLMAECLDRMNTTLGSGYAGHHNYVFGFGYDWVDGKPTNFHNSFVWSRNDKTPWPAEFHQLRVCDVDGDGREEMMQGGYAVNTSGMAMSANIKHGDRYRVSDIDPDRPGLEVFAIQQSNLLGQLLYDAATGDHIKEWYLTSVYDVARGECMDVDTTSKGWELWSFVDTNIWSCKGTIVRSLTNIPYPAEGIWWDNDLLRENLGSPGGSGWTTQVMVNKVFGSRLIEFGYEYTGEGTAYAGEAIRPLFFGDMIGDWREEVLLRTVDDNGRSVGLAGYSANLPADYAMYCLQEDGHYRGDCTCRGYYQSPNPGFYLGWDMPYPPLPDDMVTDLRWKSGSSWSTSTTMTSFDQTADETYTDGKSVIFDISGDTTQTITVSGTVAPAATYFMAPKNHAYTFAGTGSIGGTGDIWKSMRGTVNLQNVNITTTGATVISDGILNIDGAISGPLSIRARGTLGGEPTINGDVSFEGALNYEGCRLMPGAADGYGTMTFGKSLIIDKNIYVEMNIGDNGKSDLITVKGDLTIGDTLTITFDPASTESSALIGTYTLMSCTGTLTADISKIGVRNFSGHNYSITNDGRNIVLTVKESRAPAENVVWTGATSNVWDYSEENFSLSGEATSFVKNDQVVFNDDASQTTVTINDDMIQKGMTVNTDGTYTFNGTGSISGEGSLTKEGTGELIINLTNNDFTGATIINGGTVTVGSLNFAGTESALGAPDSTSGLLQINGGILKTTDENVSTNRFITTKDSATINVAGSILSLNGQITGTGMFIKDGSGQLNINYVGDNVFDSIVLRKGTIAQGNLGATLGTTPIRVTGKGTINMIANTNFNDLMPNYKHPTTIEQGASLTMGSIYRGHLNGSFAGTGDLTIKGDKVRFDVGSDFSNFEGTLCFAGVTRLLTTAADMKKLTLTLGDGASMEFYKSGSENTVTGTLQVGSLANAEGYSTFSTTPIFGSATNTFEVGYLGDDFTFAGILKGILVKKGAGEWAVTSTDNTAKITVDEGTLSYRNFGSNINATSGMITVNAGATLRGYGITSSVTGNQGAVITSGMSDGMVGTLKTENNFISTGAVLLVKVKSATSYDKFQIGNIFRCIGDTIRIQPLDGAVLNDGDKLTIFTGIMPVGKSSTEAATWVIDGGGYSWDDSALASDGYLTCTGLSTGIRELTTDGEDRWYDLNGRMLDYTPTQPGVYIRDGKKTVVR